MKKKSRRRRARQKLAAFHQAVILDHHHLMSLPGVKNVAVGVKEVRGKVTRRVCVKIYVTGKKKRLRVGKDKPYPRSARVLVPSGKYSYRLHRVPTDIVENTGFRLIGAADYFQDIPGGAQIGAGTDGALGPGTQSCVVRRQSDGNLFLLTAAHVLTALPGSVPNNVMVFQPDVTGQKFTVGRTITGYRGNDADAGAYLDVAIYAKENPARTAANVTWDPRVPLVRGSLPLGQVCAERIPVHKVGAATGYTTGLFSAFYPNFSDPQLGSFLNVLEFVAAPDSPTGTLCDSGDSGSAIVSRSPGSPGAVIGILFASSIDGMRGLVVPFEYVQRKFGIDVA